MTWFKSFLYFTRMPDSCLPYFTTLYPPAGRAGHGSSDTPDRDGVSWLVRGRDSISQTERSRDW